MPAAKKEKSSPPFNAAIANKKPKHGLTASNKEKNKPLAPLLIEDILNGSTSFEHIIADKKILQLEGALLTKDIIFVSGPTGCGKTCIVKRLLTKHRVKYSEYDWLSYGSQRDISNFTKKISFPSLIFSHPNGETADGDEAKSLVLIDNADGFDSERIMRLILESNRVILILNFLDNSLRKEIESELDPDGYDLIELNSITQSNIKKLTARYVPKEASDLISKCCGGDSRVALLMCYEYNSFGLSRHYRDVRLEFFHSLGKVLYPRKDPLISWPLADHETDHFFLFNKYLQFNCLDFFLSSDTTGDLTIAMDSFSLADSHSEYLCEYPPRLVGLLVNNPNFHGSQRKSFGFHGPPSFYF